jgi:hypothetical protein
LFSLSSIHPSTFIQVCGLPLQRVSAADLFKFRILDGRDSTRPPNSEDQALVQSKRLARTGTEFLSCALISAAIMQCHWLFETYLTVAGCEFPFWSGMRVRDGRPSTPTLVDRGLLARISSRAPRSSVCRPSRLFRSFSFNHTITPNPAFLVPSVSNTLGLCARRRRLSFRLVCFGHKPLHELYLSPNRKHGSPNSIYEQPTWNQGRRLCLLKYLAPESPIENRLVSGSNLSESALQCF